jgi:NADH-quinone oxidoreductase subunit L
MTTLIWLIPLLPFAGFLLNVFFIRREREAGYVASGVVLASFVVALVAFASLFGLPEEERRIQAVAWEWINTGGFRYPSRSCSTRSRR